MQVGLIVTLPLTGFMTNILGWASPFYLIGSVTCVWFGFWIYLVHNSPDEHPRISEVHQIIICIWPLDDFNSQYISLTGGAEIHESEYPVLQEGKDTSSPIFGNT